MPRVKQSNPRRRRYTTRPVRQVAIYRKPAGVRRYMRRPAASIEFASCKCSFNTTVQAGLMNYYRDFELSDLALPRAHAIAKEYQFYKITKIEMVVQTNYDTYPPTAPQVMPQIFWMIDKGRNLPAGLSFGQIQQLGAKPKTLNELNRRFAFAPAVGTTDETAPGAAAPAQYRISPWLDTVGGSIVGLSEVVHSGCVWGITKMTPADTTMYNVQVTLHFKFKKPQILPAAGEAAANSNVFIYDPTHKTDPVAATT